MMHSATHFENFNKRIEHFNALSCINNESYMKHKSQSRVYLSDLYRNDKYIYFFTCAMFHNVRNSIA